MHVPGTAIAGDRSGVHWWSGHDEKEGEKGVLERLFRPHSSSLPDLVGRHGPLSGSVPGTVFGLTPQDQSR
jgi:hypothetical protein